MKQVDGQPVVMKLVEDGVGRATARVVIKREEAATTTTAEKSSAESAPLATELPNSAPPQDSSL
jgi:hypothetical protein